VAGRYALIVANASYQDEKLSRLRTPAHDAEELARVLRDPEIGDFEVELSLDEPEHTLRRRVAAFFATRDRDDLLLLHFSCHGLKDDSGELYFAAANTEVAQLDATALSADFVSRQMTRSRSRKVVALLDCCYSGAIARGLRFRAGETIQLDDHLGGRGRVILTASSAMEYAFEGDELTGSGRPSVFTGAVVEGLRTGRADRDQDGRISVEDLYDYVCEHVREITPDQTPNMLSHLEGELYIARSSWIAPVEPEQLPLELRTAIESPLAGVREAAVAELLRLASGSDAGSAVTARAALRALAADDSRRVASAAARALEAESDAVGQASLAAPDAAASPEPAASARSEIRESGPAAAPASVATPSPTAAGSGAPTTSRPKANAAPSSARAWLPGQVAVVGALLVVASVTILAGESWPSPYTDLTMVATLAAVAAAALVVWGRRRDGAGLRAGAAALAAVALGPALTFDRVLDPAATDVDTGLAIVGAALLLGAALWRPGKLARLDARMPLALDVIVVICTCALALASLDDWGQGEHPSGMLLIALLLAAIAGIASAIGRRLAGRARTIADVLAIAAPAGGVLAMSASLGMVAWLVRSQGNQFGAAFHNAVALAFIAGAALAIAATVSLVLRLRPSGSR
jgi:hypothetical protein